MSIITTFPDIRGSVVYPFCYEINHHTFAILSLFRFGDHVLFSLRSRRLEVLGARKNGARERDTRIFSRARSALYVAGTSYKHLSTATESAAILSTVREMMYFTKTKRSYFRFAPPTTPESPGHDRFKQLPTLWPQGLDSSPWLPKG